LKVSDDEFLIMENGHYWVKKLDMEILIVIEMYFKNGKIM
jgi:hypothetical protein